MTFTLTIRPGECLLAQRPGHPSQVLPAGRHWRRRGTSYVRVDLRERITTTAPREILTADGVAVKVSAAVRWTVADPVAYVERAQAPFDVVYLAVQLGLRDTLTETLVEQAVAVARRDVSASLTRAAVTAGAEVGIEVREVVVKDVVLPADLRAAYAELATGKQRAQVALDKARAETAALRSLANAAKLLDDHPALAKLRLVQALPYGATIKLDAD